MNPFNPARAMMAALIVVAVIVGCSLMTGCAGWGMSPEQITAMKDINSSLCVKTASWNGSPSEVHMVTFGGKSTGTAGGGGKATCGSSVAEFTNEGKLPAAPKTVTTVTTTTPQ